MTGPRSLHACQMLPPMSQLISIITPSTGVFVTGVLRTSATCRFTGNSWQDRCETQVLHIIDGRIVRLDAFAGASHILHF